MPKDLITTVDAEKAVVGLFILLAEPTKPMRNRAAQAGDYRKGGTMAKDRLLVTAGSDGPLYRLDRRCTGRPVRAGVALGVQGVAAVGSAGPGDSVAWEVTYTRPRGSAVMCYLVAPYGEAPTWPDIAAWAASVSHGLPAKLVEYVATHHGVTEGTEKADLA